MPDIFPPNAVKYSESPVFTQDTLPDALRRDHQTKASVWGRIMVHEGSLLYLRKGKPAQTVTAAEPATIWPEEPHSVTPGGIVSFRVEFYRIPGQETDR